MSEAQYSINVDSRNYIQSIRRPCTTAIDEYFTRAARVKKSINYVPESPPRSRKLKLRGTTNNNGQSASSSGETIIREITQIHQATHHTEQRSELLGSGDAADGPTSHLRRRAAAAAAVAAAEGAGGGGGGGQAMGQAMKYYDDVQERIAEDMLQLTRSLREQTETANRIIRRDTEVVATAAHMSDRNLASLGREAEKLDEHTKRAWKCWMWLMIGFVMVIFICEYELRKADATKYNTLYYPFSYGDVHEDNEKERIVWRKVFIAMIYYEFPLNRYAQSETATNRWR